MKATVNQHNLNIPAIRLPSGGRSVDQVLNLAPYQGKTVRVYLDRQGSIQINPDTETYWQIFEATIPWPQVADQTAETPSYMPLNLAAIDVSIFFDLPE
jgi:hypothetical protein